MLTMNQKNATRPLDPETVFGPYSEWPRKRPMPRRRRLAMGAFVATSGLVLHCGVPLLG